MRTIRLGGITPNSVVDGPGLRTVVFFQGCPRHCPGCHNEELLPPDGGREISLEEMLKEIEATITPITKGITFSGGDPLMQEAGLYELLKRLRQVYPQLDYWVFTGYQYEEIKNMPLLQLIDVLVDGPFQQDKRDWDLTFRGSSNQRIIDLPNTKQMGHVVEWQSPYL